MLEVLNFIFRDFWTLCGVVILLYVIEVYCIAAPLSALVCIFNRDSKEKALAYDEGYADESELMSDT